MAPYGTIYFRIPPPPHTADDDLANGRHGFMQFMRNDNKLADTIAGEAAELAVVPYSKSVRSRNWIYRVSRVDLMADKCRRSPSDAGGFPHVRFGCGPNNQRE